MEAFRDAINYARMHEPGLHDDEPALLGWAELAHRLPSLAVDYELRGRVACPIDDEFHGAPLRAVARSREERPGESLE